MRKSSFIIAQLDRIWPEFDRENKNKKYFKTRLQFLKENSQHETKTRRNVKKSLNNFSTFEQGHSS